MNIGGTQEVLGMKVTMVRADHSCGILETAPSSTGATAAGYVVRMPSPFCSTTPGTRPSTRTCS